MPEEPPDEPALQRPRVISYWTILMAAAVLRSLRRSLAPFEISELQFIILDMCYRKEANTASSIAWLTHYGPATVSRHVERLRSRGLLRTRRRSRDRRVVELSLTDEGRMLREQLIDVAIEADDRISRHLETRDYEILLNIMRDWVMALEEQERLHEGHTVRDGGWVRITRCREVTIRQ